MGGNVSNVVPDNEEAIHEPTPETISTDQAKWRRWMIVIRVAVVTAILGSAVFVEGILGQVGFPINQFYMVLGGTYLISLLQWVSSKREVASDSLLFIQLAFDVFLVSFVVYYTGGTQSPFVPLYFFVILSASLFFRRVITLFYATQSSIFYFGVVAIEYGQLIGSPGSTVRQLLFGEDFRPIILNISLYISLFYAIALVTSQLSERIRVRDRTLERISSLLRRIRLDTNDILQNMAGGLVTVDPEGLVVYFNKAAEEILGLTAESVVGRHCLNAFGEEASTFASRIMESLQAKRVIPRQEITIRDRNQEEKPIGMTLSLLFDPSGKCRGVVANFQDLTEIKRMEELVRRSDRLVAIGQLSAGIAHEIRNPLSAICGAVEALKEDPIIQGENRQLMDLVERESVRLNRIITDFLTFARIKRPYLEDLPLKRAVSEVLATIVNDPRYTDSVTLRTDIPEELTVRFDQDQFKQILYNLLINSLDALSGHGLIEIKVDQIKRSPRVKKQYAIMSVSDNGVGIPSDLLDKIFEPFISTKQEGTGLGLALVQQMINNNGGSIEVESEVGHGATFRLFFPVVEKG